MKNQRVAALVTALFFVICLGASAQTVSFTQAASSPYATGGTASRTLSVYDFNSDGALDVITANSGTVWVDATSPNYTGLRLAARDWISLREVAAVPTSRASRAA